MTETVKTLNIYARIIGVMNEVKYIQKSGTAKGLPYKAVKHDHVTGALHMPLVNHGIVVVPTVVEMRQDGNRTIAKIDVSFVNVDVPEDKVTVTYYGYGVCSQDKGPGKAFSYAIKYALLKVFCLETGDDPENENIEYKPQEFLIKESQTKKEAQKITKEQVDVIKKMINGYSDIREKMITGYKGSLSNIPLVDFDMVCNVIKKRIEDKIKKEAAL